MRNAVESRPVPRGWRIGEHSALWGIVAQLAPFVLAFAAYLGVFLATRPDTTGDEPHYLLVAESIAYDGDVDLTNDYASRARVTKVTSVFPLDYNYEAAVYTKSGELRPAHGVGLSAFLAPAVALGGLTGARIAMVLLAALLADQLYRLLRDLRLRRRYRNLAWVAAVFCLPVLAFSSQIYPELPGALLVVVSLRIMIVGPRSPAALALGSAAAAALVWLHVRYLILSVAVLLGLAIAACSKRREGTEPPRGRTLGERTRAASVSVFEYAGIAVKHWCTVAVPIVIPYAVGFGLLAAAYQRWYGSPDPRAPYSAFSNADVGSAGLSFLYDYVLRDLLNPVGGWIPFAPVHWLGFAALGCLVVWFGWRALACIGAAVAYELVLASAGASIGWGLPGRYPMIVIPLIAIPLALVIQEIRSARFAFVPLLAASLVFAGVAVADFQGLYPIGDKPRMFGLRTTAAAYPYVHPPHLPTSFTVVPGEAPHQTGRVRGKAIVAHWGRDRPGYLLWGPYASLRQGTYRATFPVSVIGVAAKVPVTTVEVAGSPPAKIFARKVVTAGELRARRPVMLQFKTPGGYLTETRAFYDGVGVLRVGPVRVEPVHVVGSKRLPAWLLASIWIVGTVLVGWLSVRVMKRNRRPVASTPSQTTA
jgi:hypothetical protein